LSTPLTPALSPRRGVLTGKIAYYRRAGLAMGNAPFAGREDAFQESFFIPSPPMGERARVRGK